MLRRVLFVAILFCLVIWPVVTHADNEKIVDRVSPLNTSDQPSNPELILAQVGPGPAGKEEDPRERIRGIGRFVPGDPQMRVAELLLDVKNGRTGEYFYKELGKIGKNNPDVNMLLVNSVKTAIGQIGGDMLLEQFLGRRFEGRQGTPVEALIGTYRRDLTNKAIAEVIKDSKIRTLAMRTNSRVFLAFVGKWASQSPQDFTFSGDIDFSFVGGNPELIIAMRDLFDSIIMRETGGLTMKQLDSFATAHGFATSDVYRGEAGRQYGDDEIVKGKVSRILFDEGRYDLDSDTGKEAILQSLLEESIVEAGKRDGIVDKTLSIYFEKLDARANTMTEPMISMEMIRHLEHDIILHSESFPALDTIVKGCKYLYRSNLYFTKQFGVDPGNKALADFATKMTQMAKSASPGDMAAAVVDYFKQSGIARSPADVDYVPGKDGKPKAVLSSNREKALAFLQDCMKNMWGNVQRGLRIHLDELNRKKADYEEKTKRGTTDEQTLKDMEAFRKKLSQLLKGINTELEEFEKGKIELPTEVKSLCQEVVRISEDIGKITGMRKLTVEEEKQLEMVKKLLQGEPAENTRAMALSTMMDLANKFIQRTNARLDWIDDTIMGPLRGDPSFEEFIRDVHERNKLLADLSTIDDPAVKARIAEFQGTLTNRFRKKTYDLEVALNTLIYKNAVARGVKKINVAMNDFIQSTQSGRAAMAGLTAFNLTQEFSAYTQAFSRDGFSGFAAEIIRRRVPFGSAAENLYQGKYLLAGWDTIITIFPPLGLPFAAKGVAEYAATATVSYLWSSDLELLIDGLYDGASWEEVKAADVMRFKLAAVTYKKTKYERLSLEKGETFILQPDVDTVLWANLAQGDPFLELYEGLQNHPAAGDKVRDEYVRKYEERWLNLKKAYVKHMIEKLEKRKNAEEASATGKIAKMYDELMDIAGKLEIRSQVNAAMDAEWDSDNLKALWGWLKNAKRTMWGQPLAEKEATRAAAIVMTYLEKYRAVLAARTQVEGAVAGVFEKDGLGAPPTEQHRQRILTGIAFLTGRAGDDGETAKPWKALPAALDALVEQELLSIKAESVEDAKLDSPYDRETHGKVFFEDFWIKALEQMKVPVLSAGSVKDAVNRRVEARKKLVKDYRDHYALEKGTATVYVRQQHGSKRTELPVTNAEVALKSEKAEATALENRGEGQYTRSGFKPGAYVLTVKAEGFTATADGKSDAISYTVRMPSPKESGKGLDPITVYLIVKDRGKQALDVTVKPATAVVKESGEGSTLTLTPIIVPKEDSGKLNFQWAVGDKVLRSGKDVSVDEIVPITFSGQGQGGKDVKVTLVVFDEKDRQGVGESVIKVVPPGLNVKLKPHRAAINKDQSELIEVEEPRAADESFKYTWKITGDGVGFEKSWSAGYTINGPEYPGKTLTVTVTVTDPYGSTGQAVTAIAVKDEDSLAKIPVSISPQSATIAEDGEIELSVTATPFKDSGRLSFNGVAMPKGTDGYRFTYSGKDTTYAPPVTTSVTVTVKDEQGRTGEAAASIHVTKKDDKKDKGDDKPGQAPATGSVKIIAPAAVKSTEIFTVRAQLPPEIAKQAKSFRWESGYDTAYTTGPESTVQYPLNAYPKGEIRIRAHAGPLVDIWAGKAKDTSGEQLGEGKASVAVTVLKFDAAASDIWEGGPYETGDGGVSFRRKSQTRKRTDGGKEVDSASASGGVTLEMKRDHKDVDCSAAWQMGGKPVPAGHTVRSMTIGPFKGDLIEKTFTSGYRGHYQFVDVAYPEAAVSGKGCVSYGKLAIQINYSGGASGTRLGQPPGIWYDDMPWAKGKVKEIHGEILGILASVKLVPDGKRHTEPYKEKEIPVPVVKLRLSREGKLKKGEVVDVTCVVENAPEDEKPLAYTWTGDHAGSGEKVQFLAAKGGKATLTVSVAGRQGPIGAASAQFEVEDLKVKIAGLKDRVVYGTTALLSAQFDAPPDDKAPPPPADTGWKAPNEEEGQKVWTDTHARLHKACDRYMNKPTWQEFFREDNRAQWMKYSDCEEDARIQANKAKSCFLWPENEGCKDYKPPAPKMPKAPTGYRVVWQSEPAITFDPATSDGSTTVLFDRMPAGGKIKIWAQLQKHSGGGSYATVGEAPQVETIVVPPVFKWTFAPEKGKGNVGKEVKVTITTIPEGIKPELLNYEWSFPESSNRMEYEKNASAIGFVPKSPKPVMLLVAPKVPFHRELIGGSLKEEYQAGAYTVTVTGPTARGPKPQVWQEGKGLVEVDRAIAVFQQVSLRAEVLPQPEKTPRWKWDVTPSGCTVSNDISQEITVSCGETGSFEAKATAKDPDGVELGSGSGSINVTISQQTLNESAKKAKEAQDKTKQTAEAKKTLQDAKTKARKGDYDGAIKDAEDAAKFDPANKEAADTARKLQQEKETIHQQIGKAKKLMDENKFADAQKELIVASNLNSYYPPVQAANNVLGERWRKYNAEVQDKVYQVRSANEKKDFAKALEIATAWRASTKLDPYAERELKQQEDWAKQWKAQKERQIEILKAAGEKAKNYDYAGALKSYDEGFANGQNIYNGSEPEYKEAVELRSQAFTKNKRLNELIPWVRKAAEDKEYMTVDALQNTLKTADEAIALQPSNEQLKKWREQIVARAEKTKADNDHIAQGRKYLDAAGGAERGFLTNESAIQARQIQWNENVEVQQHRYLATAIQNYTESLKYIPDASVEKKIKDLQATLEARKKYLENYRLSVALKNEAEVLASQAYKEPDFEKSLPMYDQAIEKYRKSLSLYRPSSAEMIERQMWNLDYVKHDRMVKKYWADGQAVEQEGKIVEAIAIYDKAIASFHPTVPQNDRMYIIVHQQDLKNRVTGAKNWRADGETKQKAGKIAEAIASYRESLKLLPDAALAEHVRMLEGKQAEVDEKKAAADKLWQEGTALFNQGRPSDALTKFKESLGYWSDATRTQYVSDLEARRAKAVALRDEGAKLQQGNRVPEAIAKYKESLNYWPDPGLFSHITTLEGKQKQDADTAARKAKAKQLRDEGYALQQKNRLQAAIAKYKESLAIWPDQQLEDHIRQLEAKIAAVPPTKSTSPAGVGTVPSRDILTSKVWQFGRSDGTVLVSRMRLLPGGRIEGANNPNESQWAIAGNEILFYDSSGKAATRYNSFRQEGGRWVISGPFLLWGNITHVLREVADGGSPPAVTPVGSQTPTTPASTASSAAWSGSWKSDPGPDGEVVTFALSQNGNRLTGTFQVDVPYTSATGARQKESLRGTIDGTVSGSRVTGNFREGSDKGPTGSFEFTMAAAGNLFTAVVRGEDSSDTYTVRRSGLAAAPGSVQTASQTAARSVTAEITNRSKVNTHVFTEGENFGPGNRFAPGEKRKVTVAMKADGTVVFKAGRDGKVMATKTWRGNPGDTTRVPIVVFDDTNPYDKLTVTTGLR